jgi:hypothetical protein
LHLLENSTGTWYLWHEHLWYVYLWYKQRVQRSLIFWASLKSHSLEKKWVRSLFHSHFSNVSALLIITHLKRVHSFFNHFFFKFPMILWVLNIGIELCHLRTLVTQPRLQLTPNQMELRSMDLYIQIFCRFQKCKQKVTPPSLPFSQKVASRAALSTGPKKIPDTKA